MVEIVGQMEAAAGLSRSLVQRPERVLILARHELQRGQLPIEIGVVRFQTARLQRQCQGAP